MSKRETRHLPPQPLFDTLETFLNRRIAEGEAERPSIGEYLAKFDPSVCAWSDYRHARRFLMSHSGMATTFNNYRGQVERLLLWCWIFNGKSIQQMLRSDAEQFMAFVVNPPTDWIGDSVHQRFIPQGGQFVPNPHWRPFGIRVEKSIRKQAEEKLMEAWTTQYVPAASSIRQVFSICGSFFAFLIADDIVSANPFKAIKQKYRFVGTSRPRAGGKSLTKLEWDYLVETAELMADEDPKRHERTLFIVVSLFAMYLRVSDLVGSHGWIPTMGSFVQRNNGWWFEVVGKGKVEADISVKASYLPYLQRYRESRFLSPLPHPGETTPLLVKLDGTPGLRGRQIRNIVQEVFDKARSRMKADGRSDEECEELRIATLHWLRHTGATFDAEHRNIYHLQMDLRHKKFSTTQDIYYNGIDEERAASNLGEIRK